MRVAAQGLIERTSAGICRLVLWLSTAVIFLILVANTVLRYATGSSLQWANEVPELLFPWLVMAGVVLAAQQGADIWLEGEPAYYRRGDRLNVRFSVPRDSYIAIVHIDRTWSSVGASPCNQKGAPQSSAE